MSDETTCRECGKYNGPKDSADWCRCPRVRDMDVSEDAATPPTPDPRERGEAMTETDLRAADIIARAPLINTPSSMEHLARAYLALRAPAPSEAVAWGVFMPNGLLAGTVRQSALQCERWIRESAGTAVTHPDLCTVLPLYTHPAPARGVTMADLAFITGDFLIDCEGCAVPRRDEQFYDAMARDLRQRIVRALTPARGVTVEEREVMGDLALEGFIDWCDLDPTDENRSASALARQYLALRQKSRTPDAEGER